MAPVTHNWARAARDLLTRQNPQESPMPDASSDYLPLAVHHLRPGALVTSCCLTNPDTVGPQGILTNPDPAYVTCPGLTVGERARALNTPGYTPPEDLRTEPRYTLAEALNWLPYINVSTVRSITINTEDMDRIYLPPTDEGFAAATDPESLTATGEPRYTRDEILAPLLAAVWNLIARGGTRIETPTGWYDIRNVLTADDNTAVTLDDLQRLLTLIATDSPPRYTLQEAAKLLAREECDTEGHQVESTYAPTGDGTRTVRHIIRCTRCGTRYTEETPK